VNGIDVTITLDSADLEAALDRAIAGGEDLRRPMGEIAEAWIELVHERFAEERDPQGVPWAKRYGGEDPERKVLHLTGALENAVVPEFGSDFAQIGVLPTGGPGRYARIHNEGGVIKPKEKKALSFGGMVLAQVVMPKRTFIDFGPGEQAAADEILVEFLRYLFSGDAS
jgi:phage gpG-like protein